MIKSSYLLLAVISGVVPLIAAERQEERIDNSSHDSPKSPKSILKRPNEILEETPPPTPPEKFEVKPFEAALKVRKKLDSDAQVISSKAELNERLNTLAKTTFQNKKSVAGRGIKAGDYYRLLIGENSHTDSSLIKKLGHSISLQCSLGVSCPKANFCENMDTLRTISWNLYEHIEDSPQRQLLINLFVLIEDALYRKGCFDSIDRQSLLKLCHYISSSLLKQDPKTSEERLLNDNLSGSGQHIMIICTSLKSQLTPEEVAASAQLQEALGQATK
jgi:hypothetical protein